MRHVLLGGLALLVACATAKAGPAGDPLRPPAQKLPPVVAQSKVDAIVKGPVEQSPGDCDPVTPDQGPPPKSTSRKDVEEAQKIATEGLHNLVAAEKQDKPSGEVASLIEQSVQQFFQALALDPLNVRATYNLSAAYARIGRGQCAVNLIHRLVAMNKAGIRRGECVDAFQRIYGSGGKWKGQPDPDFQYLRSDKRLTDLVPPPK